MGLGSYDALSFDCYGTLIDWETGLLGVLRPWASQHGLTMTDDELLAAYGGQETREQRGDPGALYPEIVRRTMVAVGRALGADVTVDDAALLGASVAAWPAFADSPAALADLARRYRLIILSNVDRASFRGSNARLGVSFDAIVTAQDVGSYKPDRRNFEALLGAADGLGIARGRLLHVAQSIYHDHEPAKAAGLPTVWIDRRRDRTGPGATPVPEKTIEPDWTFGSLAEFSEACAREVEPRR
jgi:2-haloacid dehalogenase